MEAKNCAKEKIKTDLIKIYEDVLGKQVLTTSHDNTVNIISGYEFSSMLFIALLVKIEEHFDVEIPFESLDENLFEDLEMVSSIIVNLKNISHEK